MPTHLDRAARAERGRDARRGVPRGALAQWAPGPGRASAVETLRADAATRVTALVPDRYRRMLGGRAAFLRGAVAVHAADLATLPVCGLTTWGWGDAHAAGLVVTRSPSGRLVIDVDRYDDAAVVPFEWDVVRLAVSLVAAGRDRGLPSAATRTLAFAVAETYTHDIARLAGLPAATAWEVAVDADSLLPLADKADRSTHRSPGVAPASGRPGSRGFVAAAPGVVLVGDPAEHAAVRRAFDDLRAAAPDHERELLSRYRVADVAALARGIGGLGRIVLAVLLEGLDGEDVVACELRETPASPVQRAAPPSVHPGVAGGPAARVVTARRLLGPAHDPFLGWVEGPFGREYVWRRLPEEAWSPDLARLGTDRLRRWADRGGAALARAHARGGDAVAIASYLGSSDRFARAVADHAERYVDLVESDLADVAAALASGTLLR